MNDKGPRTARALTHSPETEFDFTNTCSVHAHHLQLVAPRVGDRGLARVGQHDRGAVGGMKREQLGARCDFGRLRKQHGDLLGADRLDVGNLAVTELRERFGRDVDGGPMVGCRLHGPRLLSYYNRVESCAVQSLRSTMEIVLTTRSGSGRTRSIANSPFFRSAASTSIPSASTNVRWN